MLPHDQAQAIYAATSIVSGMAAVATHDYVSQMWLGVPLAVVLAAFAGATFSLTFLSEMGAKKSVATVACSTGLSVFAVSILTWKFGIPDQPAIGTAGLLALFGQTLIGAFLGVLPDALKKLMDALIERVKGR
jgi:hypothetical protein